MTQPNLVTGLGGAANFGEITLPRGDDNSQAVDVSPVFETGFEIDGVSYAADEVHVSTNGYISFGARGNVSPPFGNPWIAPYNIDLDTRTFGSNAGSGQVHVDVDAATDTVTVTWDQVGRYYANGNPPFSFQLQLVDLGQGLVEILFRYGDMELDTLYGARIGAELGPASFDNPLDESIPPIDFDTAQGNTGLPGIWSYRINLSSIRGTTAGETLTGTQAADVIRARAGDDRLQGLGGDDWLFGDRGADRLEGGDGIDIAGYDSSPFGVRAVLLEPSFNTGWAAGDTFDSIEGLSGTEFDDNLRGDHGDNILLGQDGDDLLVGNRGDDTLDGGAGDDWLIGSPGADTYLGGSGIDTADFNAANGRARIDLSGQYGSAGIAAGTTFAGVEDVIGTRHADVLIGDNDFAGNALSGGGGDDWIFGRQGNDLLRGDDGDDTLSGGKGDDSLRGGMGGDTFIFTGGDDLIEDFEIGTDRLNLKTFEILSGGLTLSVQEIFDEYAYLRGGDLVLDTPGFGDTLTLLEITDIDAVIAATSLG